MGHEITRQEDKALTYSHGGLGTRCVYKNRYTAPEFTRKFCRSAGFKAQHVPISALNGIRMAVGKDRFRPNPDFHHDQVHFGYSCQTLAQAVGERAKILIDIDPSILGKADAVRPVRVGSVNSISQFARITSLKYAVINVRSLEELEETADDVLTLLGGNQAEFENRLSLSFMGSVGKLKRHKDSNGTLIEQSVLNLMEELNISSFPFPRPQSLPQQITLDLAKE